MTGAPTPANGLLTDTLVLSAGCHSGYNIVDSAAVIGQTDPYDWTQAMAQQNAVLIGGTGYQYGDTDFLEYSERLYLGIAQRLREGPRRRRRDRRSRWARRSRSPSRTTWPASRRSRASTRRPCSRRRCTACR